MPSSGTAAPKCVPLTISATRHWDAPLARRINLRAERLTLRAALERVTAATGLRVSYSTELLPLDREVCLAYRQTAVGDLLVNLLAGIALEPVVAGRDHIVLAPSRTPASQAGDEPRPLVPLEPIFATATADHAPLAAAGYAFTQIDHEQVVRYNSVAQALSASVPGVWAWQAPSGLTTHYSTRGAASFSTNSPKIFIDGIEVANPLLATQILPENIERIEVIRGPQGGALYGADAINGVTNIVTRHDAPGEGAPRLRLRSGLAVSRSDYSGGSGLGQDHALGLRMGSRLRSGTLNLGVGNVGEYVPGSSTRHVNLDGGLRLITARTLVTGTARFSSQRAGNPFGALADTALQSNTISLHQYTIGAKAQVRQSERVSHTFVLGADGYTLGNLPEPGLGGLTTADSALRAAGDGALRITARASTVLNLLTESVATTSLTLAAEHSNLHQYDGGLGFEQTRRSNGILAQLDGSLIARAFVTAGVRVERGDVNGLDVGSSVLPMLSAAYVFGGERVNARLRGAYGKAVRWPDLQKRISLLATYAAASGPIAPEQQTGLEAGLDLKLGGGTALQVTRFDQTATGLMQSVLVAGPFSTRTERLAQPEISVQSVGEIANQGWELQGSLRHGALALTGSLAFVDSRVLRVADGYGGDLRAGDRMLAVPARTASIDATYGRESWSASLTAFRAFDWINYDRAALAGRDAGRVMGSDLRDYWKRYNGSTHLRATLARNLTRSFTLLLSGDNLLDKQTGEPDNLTVVPGRTVSFGVKAAF